MTEDTKHSFGKIRGAIWPVHLHEMKKLLPMLLMFFCIAFNYTLLRDAKDALVVPQIGAEAIPVLKLFFVLPAALIFVLIYSKLSNIFNRRTLFYSVLGFLLLFFGSFGYIIHPLRDAIQPYATADKVQTFFDGIALWGVDWGIRARPYIDVFRNWTYSSFYILAEIWGSAAIALLFWGFANQITHVTESKRFYGLFALGANIALMLSGPTLIYLSNIREKINTGGFLEKFPWKFTPKWTYINEADPTWGITLFWVMSLLVVLGLIAIGTYWWINKYVLTDTRFYSEAEQKAQKKTKPKLSLKESISVIFTSKYLGLIALLIIAYGISINLVEVPWKGLIKIAHPDKNEYLAFMGKFSFYTGLVTCLMILFVGHNVIRRLGWKWGARLTPIVLCVTGIGFFTYYLIFKSHFFGETTTTFKMLGMTLTPLSLGIFLGAAQNIITKATKYALFDPTKEMSYIPLDEELKVKGKAAADVVGGRFGKSGGAAINLMAQGVMGTVAAAPILTGPFIAIVIIGWLFAVTTLGKMFMKKQKERPTA